MSLINITFDTKDKKLTCKMDGVELSDVCYVNFSKYENYKDEEIVDMRIEMMTEDEEKGLRYHNLMTANELEVKNGTAEEVPNSNGVYAYSSSIQKIKEDISNMLKRS